MVLKTGALVKKKIICECEAAEIHQHVGESSSGKISMFSFCFQQKSFWFQILVSSDSSDSFCCDAFLTGGGASAVCDSIGQLTLKDRFWTGLWLTGLFSL